ncbi:MAG: indole-3-glycerol phosphate synthase TrpC [Nitrospinota bacterium]
MLSKIIKAKGEEIEYLKTKAPLSELKAKIKDLEGAREFLKPLKPAQEGQQSQNRSTESTVTRIIAEVKKASPSQGVIREDFNPSKIAEIYQENGASAISVLTDKIFFQGDIGHLSMVKRVVTLPVLRKDFIIDEYQVFETRAYDADAILLIAAVLEKNQLKDYVYLSRELGMLPLIEVHTLTDIENALSIKETDLIGINNRDLNTFEVDIKTSEKLIQYIPKEITTVSESGIKKREDIVFLQEAGVDAFLIGETLLRERDIGNKLKELLGTLSKD